MDLPAKYLVQMVTTSLLNLSLNCRKNCVYEGKVMHSERNYFFTAVLCCGFEARNVILCGLAKTVFPFTCDNA